MTTAAEFLADAAKPRARFDRYNRYLLPHPETGDETAFQRGTSFARLASATFGLERWKLRMTARGLSVRPDLAIAIMADYDDDGVVDKAIAEAQEHAGSTVAATVGTALHRLVERVNNGETLDRVTPDIQARLDNYAACLAAHHLSVMASEQIVCLPELGLAGTLDMILTRGAAAWIADLKTGADLTAAWPEIVIQLALYARAPWLWKGDHWEPKPEVDLSHAYVVHLPAQGEGATLYRVDIGLGWEAAREVCARVREWRDSKATLAVPVEPPAAEDVPASDGDSTVGTEPVGPAESVVDSDRAGWIRGRLEALAASERARTLVGQRWPDGVTVKPPWTQQAMSALADMLDDVERMIEAPFGATDPSAAVVIPRTAVAEEPPQWAPEWPIEDTGELADADDVTALANVVAFLDGHQQARLRALARDAKAQDRPFDARPMTHRQWACARAAVSVAGHTANDDEARNLVHAVVKELGFEWHDSWLVGAVIGSLSVAQAEHLADFADAPF